MATTPKKIAAKATQARTSHEAPGAMAGYLFQIERALYHLANADTDAAIVGVETLDDVVVFEAETLRIREQDKHCIGSSKVTLGSRALWRTLQIWLNAPQQPDFYFLVTTKPPSSPVLKSLFHDANPAKRPSPSALLKSLTKAAADITSTEVRTIATAVLSRPTELRRILERLVIHVVTTHDNAVSTAIAVKLAIHDDVDSLVVVDQLFGWTSRQLLAKWRAGAPALLSRRALVRQCRHLELRLLQRRILPRPGQKVPVTQDDINKARTRHFVHHLQLISADDDDVDRAVRHFIQFNIERHRLTDNGDISDAAWIERGDALRERWWGVLKRTLRDFGTTSPKVGHRVLSDTTYDHKEPLAGEPCYELYMTSGHYHRLADDDLVWWHPQFKRRK